MWVSNQIRCTHNGGEIMFKEIKGIASNPNQIKNQIELRRIAEDAKVDRSETCFRGKSRQTSAQYKEAAKRAREAALRWF